jgi:HK97 family phage major capsid protein
MKGTLTAEQAKGLVEDIVGLKIKEISDKIEDERGDVLKSLALAIRDVEPEKKRKKHDREEVFDAFSGIIGILGQTKSNLRDAVEVSKQFGNPLVEKALGTSTVSGGGVLIEPEFADEIIGYLRADAVVMASGARTIPMESGVLDYGRVTAGATAAYRGESSNATVSQPTLGALQLKARILDVICPASNQFLNRTRGKGAAFVQEELIAAALDKMDLEFIMGDGTQDKPKGMYYWVQSANKNNETNVAGTTGGSTTAEMVKDLGNCIRLLMGGNIKRVRPGWLISPRTWYRLFTELDSNNQPVFRSELEAGKIFGIPWKETTNIGETYTAAAGSGSGSDASKVFLADFFELLVGETEALRVSTADQASYTTGGTTYNAWQRGETLVKVELEHDFAARRNGAEIAVIDSVTWGTV